MVAFVNLYNFKGAEVAACFIVSEGSPYARAYIDKWKQIAWEG